MAGGFRASDHWGSSSRERRRRNYENKRVLPSVDYIEVIVGEPTPLLLGSALELFPVPFDSIPVHGAIAPGVFRCPGANRSTNKKFRSRVRRTSIQLVGTARLLNPLRVFAR